MADHSKPLTTSTYTNFVTELDGRFDDLTVGLDPAVTTATNLATNAIRWSSASLKWQKYNGTTWGDLASSYSININGTVGATTPSTGAFTTLSATGNVTLGDASADTVTINGTIQLGVVLSGSTASDAFRITQTGAGNALVVEDAANPDSTPFVIDTDGKLISGATQSYTINGQTTTRVQVHGTTTGTAQSANVMWSGDTNPAVIVTAKSRSGTVGTHTVVQSGDGIGTIVMQGSDGSNFVTGASIRAEVDGTPSANDMPTRLVLSTTADGASVVTDHIWLKNTGRLGIGTNSPAVKVDISSTDAIKIPVGTTAQQPTGAQGMLRFNSSTTSFEGYNGTAWASVGGGATGAGTDQVFWNNGQTVNTSYSIPASTNAGTFGPVTIGASATVTIPSSSTWTVV
jgi:hypothetical protein